MFVRFNQTFAYPYLQAKTMLALSDSANMCWNGMAQHQDDVILVDIHIGIENLNLDTK